MNSRLRIVFISESPWERQAKMGYALREAGIPIMLLYMNQPSRGFFNLSKYFDYIFPYRTPEECVELVKRLSPDVIHLSSEVGDMTALAVAQNTNAKLIFDYKDMYENCVASEIGPLRWQAQRYLVEHADGICARDQQIDNYCRVNNIKLKKLPLFFPDYCYGVNIPKKQKIAQVSDVHVVMVGTFYPEDVLPQWASHGIYLIAEAMAQQEIYLHVYPTPYTHSFINQKTTSIYKDLACRTKYFILHSEIPMEKLVEEISSYDFGALFYQGSIAGIEENLFLNNHFDYLIATRIFDYITAGLDIIIQDHFSTMGSILNFYEFGSVIDRNFIRTNMKSQLLQWKADSERKLAVDRAREKLDIVRHGPRLVEFYRTLCSD